MLSTKRCVTPLGKFLSHVYYVNLMLRILFIVGLMCVCFSCVISWFRQYNVTFGAALCSNTLHFGVTFTHLFRARDEKVPPMIANLLLSNIQRQQDFFYRKSTIETTKATIEASNGTYCLRKRIAKFPLKAFYHNSPMCYQSSRWKHFTTIAPCAIHVQLRPSIGLPM